MPAQGPARGVRRPCSGQPIGGTDSRAARYHTAKRCDGIEHGRNPERRAAVTVNGRPAARRAALPPPTPQGHMTTRLPRLLLAAGLLFALALPSAALAHGGRHHERDRSHGCRAVENGRVPRGLTAAQAQSIAAACATRAAAVKAANDAFAAATKTARDTYRATVAPLTRRSAPRPTPSAPRAGPTAGPRPARTPAPPSARRSPRSRRSTAPPARRSGPPSGPPRRPAPRPCAPPSRRSAPRSARRSPPSSAPLRRPPPSRRPAPGGIPLPRRRALPTTPLRLFDARTRQPPGSERRAAAKALAMLNAAPSATTATAADWHHRQRDLVAASLRRVPADTGRATHRRWA